MSLVREQDDFLSDVAMLILYIQERGFIVSGGELWRTREQQQVYFNLGRSKTMNSMHLKRLALDLNFFREKEDGSLEQITMKPDLQLVGDYWESLSDENRWGGNWRSIYDPGHFERRV